MSLATKVYKRAALLAATARRFPAFGVLRGRTAGADLVVWIPHRYPTSWLGYVAGEDSILKDAALVSAIAGTGRPFRIVSGTEIDAVRDCAVVYSIDHYNPAGLDDYSQALVAELRRIEARGNTMYPSVAEAEWWENKAFMHRRFDELGIRSPITVISTADTDLAAALAEHGLEFPVLAKEPHSNNSQGVHRIDDLAALEAFRRSFVTPGSPEFIVQQLLDMRRDLRVTLIGGRIVHHYWRINLSDEWMPTTTRKGSQADFESFPERWRATIEQAMATIGLRSGAFDVCWDGDDLETAPYFLEVSPAYTPNPPPTAEFAGRPYSDFKSKVVGSGSYTSAFADLVFELHRRIVDAWGLL